jgi:hypothetical protein
MMFPYIGPEFIAVLTKRSITAQTWTSGEKFPVANPHKSKAREAVQTRLPLIYSNVFAAAVQLALGWFF